MVERRAPSCKPSCSLPRRNTAMVLTGHGSRLAGRCQPPPECGCDNDEHRSIDRRDRRRASIHCRGCVAPPRHVTLVDADRKLDRPNTRHTIASPRRGRGDRAAGRDGGPVSSARSLPTNLTARATAIEFTARWRRCGARRHEVACIPKSARRLWSSCSQDIGTSFPPCRRHERSAA
jgi:hypothetical protein